MNDAHVLDLIADQFGVSPKTVTPVTALGALGADSLDVLALVLRLEKTLAVRISDDEAEGCRTVGDVLAVVAAAETRGEPSLKMERARLA